jgi:hypothetical protein
MPGTKKDSNTVSLGCSSSMEPTTQQKIPNGWIFRHRAG